MRNQAPVARSEEEVSSPNLSNTVISRWKLYALAFRIHESHPYRQAQGPSLTGAGRQLTIMVYIKLKCRGRLAAVADAHEIFQGLFPVVPLHSGSGDWGKLLE